MREYTMSKYISEESLFDDMQKDLIEILNTMDIPAVRINPLDLNWLRRNLAFRNAEHPLFKDVSDMIRRIQVYKFRKDIDI